MKKFLSLIALLVIVVLSACSNNTNKSSYDGTYRFYYTFQDSPWQAKAEIQGGKIHYEAINQNNFAVTTYDGSLDSKSNKIIWNNGQTDTYSVSDDGTKLSLSVDGDSHVYFSDNSDEGKKGLEKWKLVQPKF